MPKVHYIKARKDYKSEGIKRGDMYYKWALKTGPRSGVVRRSKTQPKPSQLTTSEFYGELYSAQEDFEASVNSASSISDLEEARQTLMDQLGDLRDRQEEKLSNMPEGLQQGDTGQLLQERYDALGGYISDLEAVDVSEERVEVEQDDKDDDEDESDKADEALQDVKQELLDCEIIL